MTKRVVQGSSAVDGLSLIGHNSMYELETTDEFVDWFDGVRDREAKRRIRKRLDRAIGGNLGSVRGAGDGVSEMKIDYGPGYRLYFHRRGDVLVVLLCGGDKSSQAADMAHAKQIVKNLEARP
jgi:putative addiction module killer protein